MHHYKREIKDMKESKKAILEALRRNPKKASKFDSLVLNLALQKIDSEHFDFDGDAVYTVDRRRLIYCLSSRETFAIAEGVETIGEMAFRSKRCLKRVSIPSSVRSIERDAFYDCDRLESIDIPASVETVRGYAFAECDSLKTVVFRGQPQHLSRHAFSDDELSSISIPTGSYRFFAKALHLDAEEEMVLVERAPEADGETRPEAAGEPRETKDDNPQKA